MDSKSPVLRVPLDTDRSVFMWAFTNTGEIRIRFDEGGFIKHKFFRFVCATALIGAGEDDKVDVLREGHNVLVQRYPRGRVTVTTHAQPISGTMHMTVKVVLPGSGRTIEKTLSAEVIEEIQLRVKQIEALLETFEEDPEIVDDEEDDIVESGDRRDDALASAS
jgi:hypothetical protein